MDLFEGPGVPRTPDGLHAIQSRELRRSNAPTPLPRERPRALSIRAGDSTPEAWVQAGSPFFWLPFEIRSVIWELCLGGYVIHVARLVRRLASTKCDKDRCLTTRMHYHEREQEKILQAMGGVVMSLNVFSSYPGGNEKRRNYSKFWGILLTCRRMYSEAVEHVYRQNEFSMDHVDTLFYFWRSVTPRHFDFIRRLHLRCRLEPVRQTKFKRGTVLMEASHRSWWDFDVFTQDTWNLACGVIASMDGLQYLVLNIWGLNRLGLEGRNLAPLDPLYKITWLKRFEFWIGDPWSAIETVERLPGAPFVLITHKESYL